jgi:hypothetical protein
VEALGVPPTEAMKTRGGEIEQLIKSGEFAAADAALDKLIEDSHFKELEAEPDEVVDFAKFEPAAPTLKRCASVLKPCRRPGQEIISLPLLRETASGEGSLSRRPKRPRTPTKSAAS